MVKNEAGWLIHELSPKTESNGSKLSIYKVWYRYMIIKVLSSSFYVIYCKINAGGVGSMAVEYCGMVQMVCTSVHAS